MKQCAIEMATNVRMKFDSDIGISFTGVAGPDEQEGKPAGTVFIGDFLSRWPFACRILQLIWKPGANTNSYC